jgi:arylsulfatase A-like enzyme
MGRVLDALDANGHAATTLVVCTPDHGPAGPRMKSCLTDDGHGVFLLMRGPGGFTGGRAIDALVSQIDIAPTIYELLGIQRPSWVEGISMLPLVRGETEGIRDAVYGELTYHWAYKPVRSVRTARYRYLRRFYRDWRCDLANNMNTPAKIERVRRGAYDGVPPAEALYDLALDPCEVRNRIDDPALAEVAADLRGRLDQWMKDTADPLLDGPVPLPDDGETNPPEDIWREGPAFPLKAPAWNRRLTRDYPPSGPAAMPFRTGLA